MKALLFGLAMFVLNLLVIGCGDQESSTAPVAVDYTYAKYIHFDTSEYRFVKRDILNALDKIPEPLVNWEQSLGEPFTDINGDGIYEQGVDSFTISEDPNLNQDLNHNDQYDGPDDPWTEGIPFDDIDGNGEFRPDPGNHTTGYEVGLPYSDYNRNNRHDGDLKAAYGVAEWNSSVWYGTDTLLWLTRDPDAVYRFVSDSGLTYNLYLSYNPIMQMLISTDSGLSCQIGGYNVRLLYRGTIMAEDSAEVEIPAYPNPIIYNRWIALNQQLSVDGVTLANLVRARVSRGNYRWDYYFSQELGLVAYDFQEDKTPEPDDWIDYTSNREYYYKRFGSDHSLIFPMNR